MSLIRSPYDPRDLRPPPAPPSGGGGAFRLEGFNPERLQDLGTCAGNAFAVAAEALGLAKDVSGSAAWALGQLFRGDPNGVDPNAGVWPRLVLGAARNWGVITRDVYPETEHAPPSAVALASARPGLFSYGSIDCDPEEVEREIRAGRPVIVAGNVDSDFAAVPRGGTIPTVSRAEGGHALCIVGVTDGQNFEFVDTWARGLLTAPRGWIRNRWEAWTLWK